MLLCCCLCYYFNLKHIFPYGSAIFSALFWGFYAKMTKHFFVLKFIYFYYFFNNNKKQIAIHSKQLITQPTTTCNSMRTNKCRKEVLIATNEPTRIALVCVYVCVRVFTIFEFGFI